MSQKFDLVIIGCGMIGSVLSLSLQASGLKVAIIEQKSLAQLTSSPDDRATALSQGNFEYLEKLFEHDQRFSGTRISKITTEDGILGPKVVFSAAEMDLPSFGANVSNQALKTILYEKLPQLKDLTLFENAKIKELICNNADNTVLLESGEQIIAKLVIAADGRNSMFKKYLPSHAMHVDYQQTAYAATLQLTRPIEGSYERFFKTGPIALLPLAGNQASLIWSLEKKFVELVSQLGQESLKSYLKIHLEGIVDEPFEILSQAWFPLSAHCCTPPHGQRLLLMGDAAHSMHPVAGQGFNLGMRNVRAFVEKLKEAQSLGLDIGSKGFLDGYWKYIRTNVLGLMGVTHGLIRIFDLESSLLGAFKKTGMKLFGATPFLKRRAARFASH